MLEKIYGKNHFFMLEKLKSAGFFRERGFFVDFWAFCAGKMVLPARRFPYCVSWFPYSVSQRNKAVGG